VTAPLLSITGRVVDGVCVISVSGDVDLANSGQLRDALLRSAAAGHPVVVNLSGVTFLDATGVSALIAGRMATGGRFRLVGATGVVHRVLALTGLVEP
jgi:stage II sporulation protein AA (anti-sigma F factor antagonist)